MLPWYLVRHIALSRYIYLRVPNPKIHQIVLLKWPLTFVDGYELFHTHVAELNNLLYSNLQISPLHIILNNYGNDTIINLYISFPWLNQSFDKYHLFIFERNQFLHQICRSKAHYGLCCIIILTCRL
jgi:hypothetical protein